MQVGRFLVHVYHRRHDIFPSYPANEEICRPLEERLYLFWGFPLEELRAGGYQRIDKPCAVFPRPASSLLDTALNEVVIASLRLDDMEVVFTPACINVGVAGVLFFLSFVMGFQRPCRLPLCFSNRKIACCAILLLSPFLSYPGFSTGKIPQKIARIGLEWIEYKSIFLIFVFLYTVRFSYFSGVISVLHGYGFQPSGVP